MQNRDSDIIIIKGAPATGKSTTAKELAKYFPRGVRMEIDNLRSMVISVDWTNQKEHVDILNISIQLITSFYELQLKPIIVVDTFSGDKIHAYYEQLISVGKDWKISIFGLYASENEIQKRLDIRSDDKFKDFEICKKLNSDTKKYQHEYELQIDTTDLTAKETSELIYKYMKQGRSALR
ncbi:MAG: AAA family ATPase [Bacteroidales bacterium]|nr:AAA family ATPase [Bacteroidales bacterium]